MTRNHPRVVIARRNQHSGIVDVGICVDVVQRRRGIDRGEHIRVVGRSELGGPVSPQCLASAAWIQLSIDIAHKQVETGQVDHADISHDRSV